MKRNNNRRVRRRATEAIEKGQLAVLKRLEEQARNDARVDPPMTRDKIPMQLSNDRIYTFKRSCIGPTMGTNTSATTFGAISFTLQTFDTTSEIAENYQLYRIVEITVKFIPTTLPTTVGAGSAVNSGNTRTVIDYRNANVPVSIAELEQYKTCQTVQTFQRFTRTFTPRSLGQAYGGVTPAYYIMPAGTWASTDYNDLEYYGIKWAVGANAGLGSITAYSTAVDAVIQCRNTL